MVSATGLCVHSGVISTGRDAVHLQHLCQILHFLARQAIHDTALAFHAANESNQVFIYVLRLRSYFVIQVRTVETALEHRRIRHTQVLLNILLHLRRSRRGQRNDRRLADALYHTADLAVLRTEIMSPFRDTMRLVYSVKRNLHSLQEIYVLCLLQTLRCQIQQLRLAGHHIVAHSVDLAAA